MNDPAFFGYGSLVNIKTHDYANPQKVSLPGWRRIWKHSTLRPVAYLSAEPDAHSTIHGLSASVPGADWAALDAREYAYDRVDVTEALRAVIPTAIYSVNHGHSAPPTTQHPILLSYLDVVVQGYLHQYGESGVAHFFETTAGWDSPVLDDRKAPRYPRAQHLSSDETALVDENLLALAAQVQKPV